MSDDGVPLHVTQWKISLDKLQRKSFFPYAIQNADPYNIVDCIKKYVLHLIKLPACKNIVSFYSVICFQDETNLTISLARNEVSGLPIKSYSNVTNWTVSKVRQIANALLETLAYLEIKKLPHGNLNDSTVFIDTAGNWKVADHSINAYLNYLASQSSYFLEPTKTKDLLALSEIIESFGVTSGQVLDFIQKCNLSSNVASLMEHPLLRSLNRSFDDFIDVKRMGEGGFGEVFKVKDAKIGKEYAIKRIKDTKPKEIYKAMKEVKMLAELSHKHIVRYYRSWTETMDHDKYKASLSSEDEPMDIDERPSQRIQRQKNKR